ncbi:hypothetical protein J2125_000186 [Erwinia toletana]|uniref:Uncharacterized protein n=1 Tax=Winslowiella toletana TaxID=92490 RepID=A0ABS4P2V8_9GAMM|nr:hypothetical protein [Winslowiella toletana]MBP2166994.1 hypothetical protein [Winslowiella toletana]
MELDKLNETIARIQFIADVALIAQCKPDELKLAMSLVGDLAREIDTSRLQDAIFYQAE